MKFSCRCGNELRASAGHIGRMVLCPACGSSVVVPAPGEPGPDSGAAPPAPATNLGGRLLIGVAVVVVVLAGWWFLIKRSVERPTVDPLCYVPTDAEALVVVRLAQMWKKLPPPRGGDHDPTEELEEDIGLVPEQVERLWLVWHRPEENIGWAIIRTHEKLNRSRLVSKLQDAESRVVAGQEMIVGEVGEHGRRVAMAFPDAFTMLTGSEEGLEYALVHLGHEVQNGPLTRVLALADEHDAVAGLNHQGEWLSQLALALPVQEATATLDVVDAEVELHGRIVCRNSFQAITAQLLLRSILPRMPATLQRYELRGGHDAAAIAALGRALSRARTSRENNIVLIDGNGDASELIRALATLPHALK